MTRLKLLPLLVLLAALLSLSACGDLTAEDIQATAAALATQAAAQLTPTADFSSGALPAAQEIEGTVTRVIDGDTIRVMINGQEFAVRYIGVNTPESSEPCFDAATRANSNMVSAQTVRLVRDESNEDTFGRLLRYVYVGETFVNEELVANGWAEAVRYPPDVLYWDDFVQLEQQADSLNLGCHPTGIFNDRTYER